MSQNNSIQIFITGGTFDKSYDYINGDLYFEKTHIPEMLERSRCHLDVTVKTLMMIDSLEMTPEDRKLVVENCKHAKEEKIIITHGTDTMTETGRMLAEAKIEKTIVLTGAMIPYKFGSSDGLFNLGSALGFVQSLPKGIYIAMNGRCFDHDKVKKNKETGIFEGI